MAAVLILEGNTPEIVASGDAGSAGFVRTLLALSPTLRLHVAAPYAGPLPEGVFEGIDGVIFTGSATSWAANAPEAAPQRSAMELVFETELPVWGSCNGMQLAATVLGGDVGANPQGLEVGFARDMSPTSAGAGHPIFAGRDEVFSVPTVHRDVVLAAPAEAIIVASNAACVVQAMVIDSGGVDFWGTQYHPELRACDVAGYVRNPGIFGEMIHLADDLDVADIDELAAKRLGSSVAELKVSSRARELANWLTHIGG